MVMKKPLFVVVVLLLALPLGLVQGQDENDGAERLVVEWFDRWNALDGTDEATGRVVDLYHADAMHQVGPSARQIGPVVYNGHDAIRKMTSDFATSRKDLTFRIQTVTAREASADLLHVAEGPWGGIGVAVEFVAVYSEQETDKRFMHPGAMFVQILDGKIRRARTYMGQGERAEIAPLQ
jgi:ketosteroid isomerase-like protein